MTLLTKEDLIGGTDIHHEVVLPNGGSVMVRPLTVLEAQMVKSRKLRGMKTSTVPGAKSTTIELDLEKTDSNDFEANCMAISLGLVEPRLTLDEVKKIKISGFVEIVAAKIYEVSGVTSEALKEFEKFRSNT